MQKNRRKKPSTERVPRQPAVSRLRNIGPKTQVWLSKIGIANIADLKALGSVEVYMRMLEAGYPASLNALWALEGAIQDCDWKKVAHEERLPLLTALDAAREMRKA